MTAVTSDPQAGSAVPFAQRPVRTLRRAFRLPGLRLGFAIVLVVTLLALFAPLLAPMDPVAQSLRARFQPPAFAGGSLEYLLGTDDLGRDVLSRILYGARISLLVGVAAVSISGIIGTALGSLAGFYGGRVDSLISRLIDMQLAVPTILLALAVAAALGPGLLNVIIVLGVTRWAVYARVARGNSLVVKEHEYVELARCRGNPEWRILLRYVIPNILTPVLVVATVEVGTMIILESALSFLGLGVRPPTPSWGSMIATGRSYVATAWWLTAFPGLILTATVLGVNLLGDGIRDIADPRLVLPGRPTAKRAVPGSAQDADESRASVEAVGGGGAAGDARLVLRDVIIDHFGEEAVTRLVHQVNLAVRPGEIVGVVGESGSGKSLTALACMGLLGGRGSELHVRGSIRLNGRELVSLPEREMRKIRGDEIAIIFQEPMTALNPVFTIGDQITAGIRAHSRVSGREAEARALSLLEEVGLPSPERRLHSYPHELSGGQRQRAMIALAMAMEPQVLICDEPTTALDVTTQAQILALLETLRERHGTSIIFISHDLAVAGQLCDRIAVMYVGHLVEYGPAREVLSEPRHPYTRGLIQSVPSGNGRQRLPVVPGQPPLPGELPAGCPFRGRCPYEVPECANYPRLVPVGQQRWSRCSRPAARMGEVQPDVGAREIGTEVRGL